MAEGRGFYNEHSSQQAEASDAGVTMFGEAAAALPDPLPRPLVIADFGASEGRNSLDPLRVAIAELRRGHADLPVAVVHTDLAANDFSTLFETVATDPNTYAGPDVYTYAIGRSFYERLFPAGSVMLGWSATAVLWLSHTPCPIPDHLFSFPATGEIAQTWAASAAEDWRRFLDHRAVELRPGAQVVVSALVADPEVLPWMAAVEEGAQNAVDAGVLAPEQLQAMVVPTILRDADEWVASVTDPFEVVDHRTVQAPDPAYTAYEDHHDSRRYAAEEVAAFRAWSEGVLTPGLSPSAVEGFYGHVQARLADKPVDCPWRIGLLRMRRR